MKILAIIPARGGSKRLPNKNIKQLNGKPLIHYPIELAQQAQKIGVIVDHIISTDDKKIASIAKKAGGNVPFLRPDKLATDESKIIGAVQHAVNWWQKKNNDKINSVLLLQPTSPLTNINDVEAAVKYYNDSQPSSKCLVSVYKAQDYISDAIYQAKGKYLKQVFVNNDQIEAGQGLQQLYLRNGGLYITRCDLLFEEKIFIDENPLFYEMPRLRSVAIDDMFDWIMAESLMKYRNDI